MRAREVLFFTLFLGACSSGPKYRIDDNTLAQIPLQEKQGVMSAQQEQLTAKEEIRKANADYGQADRELDAAENDLKAAKLQLDSAKLNRKSAEASGDLNKKSAAERDIHVAEMG